MRPPLNGTLVVTQLFGGNPASEQYVNARGQKIIGHDGIDIACLEGDLVYPAFNGLISFVDARPKGFGYYATVQIPGTPIYALYGHLSGPIAKPGDRAVIHVPFAFAGSTGNSTGPHVHFGIYHGAQDNGYGGAVDPISDLDRDVWPNLDLRNTNL